MAFDVTPTSGAVPYTYTSSFLNKDAFSTGFFRLELKILTQSGSCAPPGDTGTESIGGANALLANDVFVKTNNSVPIGSCSQSNLIVRDLRTNEVVSLMSVTINNV